MIEVKRETATEFHVYRKTLMYKGTADEVQLYVQELHEKLEDLHEDIKHKQTCKCEEILEIEDLAKSMVMGYGKGGAT